DVITKPTCQSFLSDGIKKQFIENVNKVQGGLILKFQFNGNLHKLFGLPQEHEDKISNIIFGSVSNELKQYTDLLEKYKNLVEEYNNLEKENQKIKWEQKDVEIIKKCKENAARLNEIRNKQNELKINMDDIGLNIWNHCNKSLFDIVNKNYGASFDEKDTIESVFNKSKDLLIGEVTGVETEIKQLKSEPMLKQQQQTINKSEPETRPQPSNLFSPILIKSNLPPLVRTTKSVKQPTLQSKEQEQRENTANLVAILHNAYFDDKVKNTKGLIIPCKTFSVVINKITLDNARPIGASTKDEFVAEEIECFLKKKTNLLILIE
ncbi:MAG: hypothetical protein LBC92_05280, partial [Rickettsiales bacterium]|nr:hypothetical protein [Rickettsiales bacterium]